MKMETNDNRLLVDAFFRERSIVNHHIASFNDFILNRMQRVIDTTRVGGNDQSEFGMIHTEIEDLKLKMGRVTVGIPTLKEAGGSNRMIYPMEARLRNITYAAPVYVEFTAIRHGQPNETIRKKILDMPIMVRSSNCNLDRRVIEEQEQRTLTESEYRDFMIRVQEDPDDPGGYFIINGTERTLITWEDLAPNRIIIGYPTNASSKKVPEASVMSLWEGRRPKCAVTIKKEMSKERILEVHIGNNRNLNLIVLLRALGLETDEQIIRAINTDGDTRIEAFVTANIEIADEMLASRTSRQDAMEFLGGNLSRGSNKDQRMQAVENLMNNTILPHLGQDPEDRLTKALFLARMARGMLQLQYEKRSPDDRDHYGNKRLSLAGDMMEELFRMVFRSLCEDMRKQLQKNYDRNRGLDVSIRDSTSTNKLQQALASGNWPGDKKGVTQQLDRTSNLAMISNMRRVTNSLTRTRENFEARDLHPTHWGRLCPNETPEGANCGLVKNLALMVEISEGFPEREVKIEMNRLGMQKISQDVPGYTVLLNGNLIGMVQDAEAAATSLRARRREGAVSNEINVRVNHGLQSLIINCDKGRVRRPLLSVENGKRLYTQAHAEALRSGEKGWTDLVNEGIIEYIDADEEENLLIAINEAHVTKDHTHCEVDPMALLGIGASLIPFPQHNASPRVTMGAGMGKQSLGFSAANYRIRPDTRGHLLHYPQMPIAATHGQRYIHYERRPAGQNFVVGVMSFHGYNMEDAIVMNKASIERGLGRSTFFRTYSSEERKYIGNDNVDKFCRPDLDSLERRSARSEESYDNIDDDGLAILERPVKGGDVIVGRTSPLAGMAAMGGIGGRDDTPLMDKKTHKDTSEIVRSGEKGYVDSVMMTKNPNEGGGRKLVKVRVRDQRIPELGDKFASKHGQKGVLGLIVPQEGMPFDEMGITPDIVVNPHAIPSRMTVAHVLEALAGLIGSQSGQFVDATAFTGTPEEELRQMLLANGFKHNGKRVMHDGQTGRQYQVDIFMGCIYYLKLHHMVSGKIHSRSKGPIQNMTRQPTEGRARDGGLRFGEMERDALMAHGASMALRDRLLEQSDLSLLYVDKDSGFLVSKTEGGGFRGAGSQEVQAFPIETSHAFKLMLDEIMSMIIRPRLMVQEKR